MQDILRLVDNPRYGVVVINHNLNKKNLVRILETAAQRQNIEVLVFYKSVSIRLDSIDEAVKLYQVLSDLLLKMLSNSPKLYRLKLNICVDVQADNLTLAIDSESPSSTASFYCYRADAAHSIFDDAQLSATLNKIHNQLHQNWLNVTAQDQICVSWKSAKDFASEKPSVKGYSAELSRKAKL